MFSEVMRYILDLGPTVMLPIVIIIFSKILGMKAGDCFKAGLHIGIGFVGIGLVIGLMLDSIGPAAKAMAENFDLNLHVVDVGWPGSSPMTWASQIALVAIPIAILVNVAMLLTRMTRVVNVDIWNIWHMTFTGAKDEGLIFAHGKPLRKVKTGNLVDELFAEIDKSLDRGKVEVDDTEAAEGADWLAKIEEENAGELTPERIAAMEAAAAKENGETPEPFLKPVQRRVELDEDASPTAGRRFSRT